MSRLQEVGDADDWRCWLCDEPVDPEMSVNDRRGPSLDARTTKARAKAKGAPPERLAHRGCNTGKGAVTPVVPWPDHLFVADAVPILAAVDRLDRKGGREVMGRCTQQSDAHAAAAWLSGRVARLHPGLGARVAIEPGGGQHLLVLHR